MTELGAVAAAVLAGSGAGLLVPARPARNPVGGWPWLALALAGAALVVAVLRPDRVVPALVLAAAAGGLLWLRGRRRAAVGARARAARVQEACEVMAGELAAGLPPGRVLAAAATVCPELTGVVAAHRLGGSVPESLRAAAVEPGAGDLVLVAAAWQVAHRSGAGLAEALGGVSGALRERQSLRRMVASELASARATARLMVALPALTLLMGSGIGGDPLGFLVGTPGGWACLAGGLALELAGLGWIEAIARAVEERAA
ncbi:MAG: type II secretion system F family protein [Nocardioides sp.]